MTIRINEVAARNYERARSYLAPRTFDDARRRRAEDVLKQAVASCGPVVDAYPSWHPLIPQNDRRFMAQHPSRTAGYEGLDHTVYLAHGIISCPYGDNGRIFESVASIKFHDCVEVEVEDLGVPLYNDGTEPVLIRCEWRKPLEEGNFVPKSLAVPLMLEQEVPNWRTSEVSETWDDMRPYLLGGPHGQRSSLFVTQEVGTAIKRTYECLIDSGMFGPTR